MAQLLSRCFARSALLTTGAVAAALAGCSGPELPSERDDIDPERSISVAERPPPAISGGTLLIARDGHTAVAADSDRDRVWIVDLASDAVSAVPLERGDEPGRVVEDRGGRVHVALRRAGAVATIDLAARAVIARREVCAAPRGLAYEASRDVVHVACAGGELVTLPASGGAAVRKLRLDSDLRDIVVDGERLLISRFKSAETLVVGPEGQVLSRRALPDFGARATYTPSVAWRMAALPGGGAVMAHQRALSSQVVLAPGGYYQTASCDGNIVHSAISVVAPADELDAPASQGLTAAIPDLSLPVDIAVAPDGARLALVAAGSSKIVLTDTTEVEAKAQNGNCSPSGVKQGLSGQPVAVAFDGAGAAIAQLRVPAALEVVGGRLIPLPGEPVKDTGHDMFHLPPSPRSAVACASCHPEGHEDGRTWDFDPVGLRRTQAVGGGVLKTAPLHWSGDQSDLESLMSEVFVSRMGGAPPGARRLKLMARFIDSLPAFPASPPEDEAAVARGAALFHTKQVGCADCHSGPMLTNNASEDVGTGAPFQVPALIGLSGRAPFMHDGCAATLRDRFDPACGGVRHGDVTGLSPAQLDDLIAYLESL